MTIRILIAVLTAGLFHLGCWLGGMDYFTRSLNLACVYFVTFPLIGIALAAYDLWLLENRR